MFNFLGTQHTISFNNSPAIRSSFFSKKKKKKLLAAIGVKSDVLLLFSTFKKLKVSAVYKKINRFRKTIKIITKFAI